MPCAAICICVPSMRQWVVPVALCACHIQASACGIMLCLRCLLQHCVCPVPSFAYAISLHSMFTCVLPPGLLMISGGGDWADATEAMRMHSAPMPNTCTGSVAVLVQLLLTCILTLCLQLARTICCVYTGQPGGSSCPTG